jgi:hypothetical protein
MTESQTSSLKVLGVPFFGTRPQLVLLESEGSSLAANAKQQPAGEQKITKAQLLQLQQKMLNHLMELYGD